MLWVLLPITPSPSRGHNVAFPLGILTIVWELCGYHPYGIPIRPSDSVRRSFTNGKLRDSKSKLPKGFWQSMVQTKDIWCLEVQCSVLCTETPPWQMHSQALELKLPTRLLGCEEITCVAKLFPQSALRRKALVSVRGRV